MSGPEPLLAVEDLNKSYIRSGALGGRGARVDAVSAVSFQVDEGETLGIAGESGSGKSTLARMVVGLEAPSSGCIHVAGRKASPRPNRAERRARARVIQIVFQDPYQSLDPRQSCGVALGEVQRLHFRRSAGERRQRTSELMDAVALGKRHLRSLPRELSGGQRQRLALARALAVEPRMVILDEAVSALDVSIQAQVLNLLADLREEFNLAYLFVSHDLAVIRQVSDRVLIMFRGVTMETGAAAEVLSDAANPYTQELLESAPRVGMRLERKRIQPEGVDGGCRFRGRCPNTFARCQLEPPLIGLGSGRASRCWLAEGSSARNGDR